MNAQQIPVAAINIVKSNVPEIPSYCLTTPDGFVALGGGNYRCTFLTPNGSEEAIFGEGDLELVLEGDRFFALVVDEGETLEYRQLFPRLDDPPKQVRTWKDVAAEARKRLPTRRGGEEILEPVPCEKRLFRVRGGVEQYCG